MAREWNIANANELVLGLGNFNGHVGKCAEGFEGIHGGYGIRKRSVEERMLLDFCDQKDLHGCRCGLPHSYQQIV